MFKPQRFAVIKRGVTMDEITIKVADEECSCKTAQEELNEAVLSFANETKRQCALIRSIDKEMARIRSTLTESEIYRTSNNEIYDLAVANLGLAEALIEAGLGN